ncbi:hypothetical protein EV44_g3644 [Erysiphe necator]|uniref:Uncharacterized protein n=1 Tax=Uncinula necator TaxID=52586 RepID=A0A0B1NV33_UNCNE|nr:hypothetical protein EV44_g3644 [Erysiphe necator]
MNQSTFHALTRSTQILGQNFGKDNTSIVKSYNIFTNSTRYNSNYFYGILIDTGASISAAGLGQYNALKQIQHLDNLDINANDGLTFKFGIGETPSLGVINFNIPMGYTKFHVVNADIPFLLSLRDLDNLGCIFDNQNNCIRGKNPRNGKTIQVPVIRRFDHPFVTWGSSLTMYCTNIFTNEKLLNDQELRQLHRRFGHPSARRLGCLLKRSYCRL